MPETQEQLALCQPDWMRAFAAHTAAGKSNTVDLFDCLLTFSTEHHRTGNHVLDAVKQFQGSECRVRVYPGAISRNGQTVLVLPGKRESLIEKAVRKLAADGNSAVVRRDGGGDCEVWVQFSLYRLRSLLAELGHGFKLAELREGLEVLHGARMEVIMASDSGASRIHSSIFPSILWRTPRDKLNEHPKAQVCVNLHPLLTRAIAQCTFRAINFSLLMRPKNELARWLFVRLAHNYTQASNSDLTRFLLGDQEAGYHLSLRTIIRETCLRYASLRFAIRAVRTALVVLHNEGILCGISSESSLANGYSEEIRYLPRVGRGRRRIMDVVWHLFPSEGVVDDIIEANRTHRRVLMHRERDAACLTPPSLPKPRPDLPGAPLNGREADEPPLHSGALAGAPG
jgi:hypothetical protein